MSTAKRPALLLTLCGCLVCTAPGFGQNPQPNQGIVITINQKPKSPPDELKSFLNALEEAYKAPREVDEDIRDELRKQYKGPTPEREAKILREIRRLYSLTADREGAIAIELKRAYEQQTPEQEARVFAAIRRGGTLPLGTVAPEANSNSRPSSSRGSIRTPTAHSPVTRFPKGFVLSRVSGIVTSMARSAWMSTGHTTTRV